MGSGPRGLQTDLGEWGGPPGDGVAPRPPGIGLAVGPLAPHIHLQQLPPFEADPVTGDVTCTLGGLDMLADAVLELASRFGRQSVVVCQYQTMTPEHPLALTGRTGEPVVVTIGEAEFELPPRDER